MEKTRTYENQTRSDARVDDLAYRPPGIEELTERMDLDDATDGGGGETTVAETADDAPSRLFVSPDWLKGMFPIAWSNVDGCRKNVKTGQNCCLFYPLGYCRDMDVINGFCVFHLRAVFNLVYQTDCVYLMTAKGKPAMVQRTACYVAEPQIINDEYTAIFPLVELMENEMLLGDVHISNCTICRNICRCTVCKIGKEYMPITSTFYTDCSRSIHRNRSRNDRSKREPIK